jgi:hypothetical protein
VPGMVVGLAASEPRFQDLFHDAPSLIEFWLWPERCVSR